MNRRPARTDNGKIFPARTFPGQSGRNSANLARRFANERRCSAPRGSPRLNVAPSFLASRRLSTDRRRIRSILIKSPQTAPFPFVENRRPDSPSVGKLRSRRPAPRSGRVRATPRRRGFSGSKSFPRCGSRSFIERLRAFAVALKIRLLTARGGFRPRKARFELLIPFQTAFRQSFDAARARLTALK